MLSKVSRNAGLQKQQKSSTDEFTPARFRLHVKLSLVNLNLVQCSDETSRWVAMASWEPFKALTRLARQVPAPSLEHPPDSPRPWRMSRSERGRAPSVGTSSSLLLPRAQRSPLVVTFISLSIILSSIMLEFVDYRRVQLEPSIVVDRSRGEKLVIEMDITFPKVPCYREWLYILIAKGWRT